MTQRRFPRTLRLNAAIHEVLADELEAMSDPRLELVTVTGVEVSPDLKHAKVFYSALTDIADSGTEAGGSEAAGAEAAEESRRATANALETARRHLQAALGRQMRLKYVPRLIFVEDPALARGRRIDEIIRHLHDDQPADA